MSFLFSIIIALITTQGDAAPFRFALQTGSGSNLCIDVKGKEEKPGVDAILMKCGPQESQKWKAQDGQKPGPITSRKGFCLQPKGKNGTSLEVQSCSSAPAQTFVFLEDGRIRHQASNKCLIPSSDSSRADMLLDDCRTARVAHWIVTRAHEH